ncbi:MAG: UDP-3-O-(3-hydroxymyristoyl)glucosamine N-acyltransferase, partial [Muribaculaceae bacterium]
MELTAAQLAALVQGEVVGDLTVKVNNFAKIEEGREGCVSFLANPKYTHFIYSTNASVVLVRKDFVPEHEVKATLIKVEDPYATLAELLNMVSKQSGRKSGIEQPNYVTEGVKLPENIYLGAFTYVGIDAKIGANVQIYPQCYIGDGVIIGENTIIYPGVKIYAGCVIGSNCILHSGVVIGSDGFGFAPENGEYVKIAQIGNVIIEDNVEIGANTTIDRATMGSTIVHRGVKLDNLIQVAHNVEIGEHTVMAAQVGVAGSTKIGKYNMVGGQVGFAGHIIIGDLNQIGAQSGIPNSVGSKNTLMGYPAVNSKDFARQTIYVKNLASLNKTVGLMGKKIEELE